MEGEPHSDQKIHERRLFEGKPQNPQEASERALPVGEAQNRQRSHERRRVDVEHGYTKRVERVEFDTAQSITMISLSCSTTEKDGCICTGIGKPQD